jgi:hypothetical protein
MGLGNNREVALDSARADAFAHGDLDLDSVMERAFCYVAFLDGADVIDIFGDEAPEEDFDLERQLNIFEDTQ